jgi:heme exporter protein CcmD
MSGVMSLDHAGFILAAYLAAGAVLLAIVLWVVLDYRAQKRALSEIETRLGRRQ